MAASSLDSRQLADTHLYGRASIFAVLALNCANAASFVDIVGIGFLLPEVAKHFHGSETIDFAPTAQLIGAVVGLCILGYLSDIFSRRVMLLIAIGIQMASAMCCALNVYAHNPAFFVVARAFAGIASGSISNLVNIAQNDISPEERRLQLQGFQGCSVALGSIVALLSSAGFVEMGSWQWFYWTLTILSFGSWLAVFTSLPSNLARGPRWEEMREVCKTIDWLGITFLTIGIISGLLCLCKFDQFSKFTAAGLLSTAGVSLFAFGATWKYNIPRVRPIIPFHLLKNMTILAVYLQNILFGAAYYTFIYFVPLTLLLVRQYKPLVAAAFLVPYFVVHGLVSTYSAQVIRVMKRKGYKRTYSSVFFFGYAFWGLAMSLLAFDSTERLARQYAVIVLAALVGLGTGSVFQNSVLAISAQASKEDKAIAVGTRNVCRFLGGASGTAMASAVLHQVLKSNLPHRLQWAAKSAVSELSADKLGGDLKIVIDVYAKAIGIVFYIATGFLAGCFLLNFLIKDQPKEIKQDEEKGVPESGLISPSGEVTPAGAETPVVGSWDASRNASSYSDSHSGGWPAPPQS